MNYEIEQKLNRKVDDWEFRALQSTVDQQKHEIKDLNNRINNLEGVNNRNYDTFTAILNYLINKDQEGLDFYELNQIKNYI